MQKPNADGRALQRGHTVRSFGVRQLAGALLAASLLAGFLTVSANHSQQGGLQEWEINTSHAAGWLAP
ncbi:MAG: hypothetical protein ABSA59_04470, partial [Terriglobia bacterium]